MAWHEMTAGMRSDGEQSIRENFWRQPRTYPWMLEIGVLAMVITSLWVKQVYFSIAQRATWSPSEETFWHWSQTHSSVFSLSLAILMLLFGLFPLIPRYWRFALLHVLNLFLTSLIVADFIHARFFGAAISVLSLYNAHMLGAVVPSIVESIRPSYLILYLDVILGIIALPYYWRACRNAPGLRRKHTGPVSLALVAAGLLLFSPSARLMEQRQRQAQTVGFQREICSALGLFPYHFWDAVYHLGPGRPRSKQADLNRVRDYLKEAGQQGGPASKLFGAARGRNLILMSAESVQAFPIGLEVEGQPVTPNLSAFIKESLYFTNFYDQTNQGRTSDGEFISLNSLHPLSIGDIPTQYNANFFHGVPTILARHGYATLSACAAPGSIWNMRIMHSQYGFKQSFYEDSFKVAERINGAWMLDSGFFTQTAQLLQAHRQPFMAFMLSSSSHNPFKIPEKHRSLRLGKLEGTLLGDYLQAVRYFDQSFGEFVEGLRKAGLLDQCVIAIYGDHKGVLPEEIPQLAELVGVPEPNEFYKFKVEKKVPFIVRLPGGAGAKQMTVTGGHLDIAPTLLSLLGFSAQEGAMLGKDLLQENDHLVVFRDGGFADGKRYFISRADPSYPPSCYESETGQKIACAPFEQEHAAALERLEISDLIISGNMISEIVTKGESATQRGGVNALRNPGFEELAGGKPTVWGLTGRPLVDALGLYAAEGKVALQSGGARDVFYQTVSVKPDKPYLLECDARSVGPEQQGRLQINWFDAGGKLLKEQVEVIKVGQRWEWYGRTVIPPPHSASATLYVGALDPSAVWFDNLFFGETR